MAEVRVEDAALRIAAVDGTTMRVGVGGWRPADDADADADAESMGLPPTVPLDEVVAGRASHVRVRTADAIVRAPAVDLAERVDATGVRFFRDCYHLTGPTSTYWLQVNDRSLTTYVRFEGAPDVLRRGDEEWVVSFEHPTRVVVGVRDRSPVPRGTVTVPRTPEGMARAVSTFPAALRTTAPDRSFPTLRIHPPRVEFGDETDVPEHVADRVPETGIELAVSPEPSAVLVVAPLAYYLAADVVVEDRDRPALRAPAAGVDRSLPALPGLQSAAADLLERTFWLDCLVRNAGPHGAAVTELEAARAAGLEPDLSALYDASPAERLARYLDAEFEAAADVFPNWPVAARVADPTVEAVRTLPALLDDVARVYVDADRGPDADGSARERRPPPACPTPGPDDERILCRLAGSDVDHPPDSDPESASSFATTHAAVEGAARRPPTAPVRVLVVDAVGDSPGDPTGDGPAEGGSTDDSTADDSTADDSTADDSTADDSTADGSLADGPGGAGSGDESAVGTVLTDRAAAAAGDYRVDRLVDPTRERLRSALAAGPDLLYYRGGGEGFDCADGRLSAGAVPAAGVGVALLDAPRSATTARRLVDGDAGPGSGVDAAVGLSGDGRLGTAPAGLLLEGACVADAVWVGARYAGADPATAVGDGRRVLSPDDEHCNLMSVRPDGDGVELGLLALTTRPGGVTGLSLSVGGESLGLPGSRLAETVDPSDVPRAVSEVDRAFVYRGELHWPERRWRLINPTV